MNDYLIRLEDAAAKCGGAVMPTPQEQIEWLEKRLKDEYRDTKHLLEARRWEVAQAVFVMLLGLNPRCVDPEEIALEAVRAAGVFIDRMKAESARLGALDKPKE